MSSQTPQGSTPPRFCVLTDGTGHYKPASLFGRSYDLPGGLASGEPVAPSFRHEERRDRALSATTSLECLLEFATWPLRVYELEGHPLGDLRSASPCFDSVTVMRQLSPAELLGPDGVHVAALLNRVEALQTARDRADILRSIAEAMPAAEASA